MGNDLPGSHIITVGDQQNIASGVGTTNQIKAAYNSLPYRLYGLPTVRSLVNNA
ncbi:MAG: hypothetical protein Q8S19_03485 [Bacillota bacterium]|nr:hypothetical protein [Bacillota bacterium]